MACIYSIPTIIARNIETPNTAVITFGVNVVADAALLPKLPVALGNLVAMGYVPAGAPPLGRTPVLNAPLAVGTAAVFAAGVAYANVDDPTSSPFEASESRVSCCVTAGPPIESVVPSTSTAVLPSGVKVSPPAVSALSLVLLLSAVARGMVDVPTIRDPAGLIEYVVPLTTIAEDPGRIVEWSISKPPLLPGRAVSVFDPIARSEVVGAAIEKGMRDVPTTTADGPREYRVPDIVMACPPCVRAVPAKENTAARCGAGVAFAVTGVYVMPPTTIGLESACAGSEVDSSISLWSLLAPLLGCP